MTTQPKTTEAENPYLTREDALAILNTPDDQLDELIARAEKLRRKYKGDNVGIHILTNARSGNCSQDCAYCAQSCRSSADIEKYKWVSDEKLYRDNDFVNKNHLARHCIGLSGMKFTDAEIEELAAKIRKMKETGTHNEAQLLHYYEPAPGIFIAESPKVIERALEFGCEPISLLMEQKDFDTCGKNIIAQCKNIPVYTAKLEVLEQITGYKLARGMLCAMHRPAMPSAEEICKKARRIAVLENVVNPTNVGAIFRSAAALNMDAVLLTSACSDPLHRRAIRVSMGTVFQVPWTYIENKNVSWPQGGMDLLHEYGFKTVAMALRNDSVRIDEEKLHEEEKLAIILGTEGDGLAAETMADCDYTVKIPMSHGVDSLNVAAASAVAFWEFGK